MALTQKVLPDTYQQNPLNMHIRLSKSIEFHLQHQEILQLYMRIKEYKYISFSAALKRI